MYTVLSVYPRWRGEHFNAIDRAIGLFGLSPLARGTLGLAMTDTPASRFIPAGAGNTVDEKTKFNARSVYPRWRGEHWRRR